MRIYKFLSIGSIIIVLGCSGSSEPDPNKFSYPEINYQVGTISYYNSDWRHPFYYRPGAYVYTPVMQPGFNQRIHPSMRHNCIKQSQYHWFCY